jgi:hypothetical protein
MSNFLIQSSYGTAGNFEAVVPGGVGGLVHVWRNNDDPALPWYVSAPFATNLAGQIQGIALIQSSFGNLEIVVVANNQLLHFYRPSLSDADWTGPTAIIGGGVSGTPAFIQSSYGTIGNFEVVVPGAGGGLIYFSRNNNVAGFPWSAPLVFDWEGGGGQYLGASLIQSSFGNLEVVATAPQEVNRGGLLEYAQGAGHFWMNASGAWTYTTSFGDGITGTASLIQSNFGSPTGDFEVVGPFNLIQEITHCWRNNNTAGFPWETTGSFGPPDGGNIPYVSVGLIQSSIDNSLVAAALLDGSIGFDIYTRTNGIFNLSTTVMF